MADLPIGDRSYGKTDYQIDHTDEKDMWEFAMESCRLAGVYAEARRKYGAALKELKLALARQYRDRKIERKLAEDKAYLIMAEEDPKMREYLTVLIVQEQEYKGIEKVMDARSAALSFNQSLIKNQIKNT